MTQQLVTIHGCKYTDASVVISWLMHSTGRGSTAQRLGDLEGKALCGGGKERGYGRVQLSCTDSSAAWAPKPCFEALLSDEVGIPVWSSAPGHNESCCDSWWHWHEALGVSSSLLAPCNSPAWSGARLGQEVTQPKWSVHPLAERIIKHFDLSLDRGKEYFESISEKAGNYL